VTTLCNKTLWHWQAPYSTACQLRAQLEEEQAAQKRQLAAMLTNRVIE
jgi:hypothetical protein